MGVSSIGEIILKLREDRKISREALSKGLCSGSMLAKIENGERYPDIALVDGLLKRLGKSPDKLEVIVSYYEYKKMEMYDEILDALRLEQYEGIINKIETYEEAYGKKSVIDLMYVLRLYAIYVYQKEQDLKKAEDYLDIAIWITSPDINIEEIQPYTLATFEIENLLMRCRVWMQTGRMEQAKEWTNRLAEYVKKCISDEEERSKIYPKVAWIQSVIALQEQDYESVVAISKEAVELLLSYYLLGFANLHLELLEEALRKTGRNKEAEQCLFYKKTIEDIYEMFEMKIDWVNKIYYSPCVRQYYLDGEIVREARQGKQMKQTDFMDGIFYNEESLSRVETGKAKVSHGTFVKMMERANVERERYTCYMNTSDFETLESIVEIQKATSRRDYEFAEALIKKLEAAVDMKDEQNAQLVEFYKTDVRFRSGKIKSETAMVRLKRLLEKTYDCNGENSKRRPFYTEANIILQISMLYDMMGQKEQAAEFLLETLKTYQSSRIEDKYNYRIIGLMGVNLCAYTLELGNAQQATKIAEGNIKMSLLAGKAQAASGTLPYYAAGLERQGVQSLPYFERAYALVKVYPYATHGEALEKYIKEHFNN